jgi:hypothetical protein
MTRVPPGSRPARGALERALLAGGVAAGLGVLAWLVIAAIARFYLPRAGCQQQA